MDDACNLSAAGGALSSVEAVAGIVLAGGRGRRMGQGEKCLRRLGGRTLLEHAMARLAPQTCVQLLSFNGDTASLPVHGTTVVPDSVPGFAGPLAGVLAGLEFLADRGTGPRWLASVPCDCPWLPLDLVARLHEAALRSDCELAVARSAGRVHPVVALWSRGLCGALRETLLGQGLRGAGDFVRTRRHVEVEWPGEPVDPFFNINTPADLARAERMLAAGAA